MSGGLSEFVRNKDSGPPFRKGARGPRRSFDLLTLAFGGLIIRQEHVNTIYPAPDGESSNSFAQSRLQGAASRDDSAYRYNAVCMQAFKIVQIPIKEGILVVPFDLKSKHPSPKSLHMVNLVRNGLFLFSVNNLLHLEIVSYPTEPI